MGEPAKRVERRGDWLVNLGPDGETLTLTHIKAITCLCFEGDTTLAQTGAGQVFRLQAHIDFILELIEDEP